MQIRGVCGDARKNGWWWHRHIYKYICECVCVCRVYKKKIPISLNKGSVGEGSYKNASRKVTKRKKITITGIKFRICVGLLYPCIICVRAQMIKQI